MTARERISGFLADLTLDEIGPDLPELERAVRVAGLFAEAAANVIAAGGSRAVFSLEAHQAGRMWGGPTRH